MEDRFTGPAAGSSSAFAQRAFQQFRAGLYRFLLRKLHNAESAEDLTQEVYLRLLRGSDRHLIRDPRAYVFGVAFNVLSEFRLHEEHEPIAYNSEVAARAGEELADESATLDSRYDQGFRERWLDRVLAQLSPMQQAVLLMAKRKGMAHEEIARKLGISVGTVRKHLSRAIAQCRKRFDDQPRGRKELP